MLTSSGVALIVVLAQCCQPQLGAGGVAPSHVVALRPLSLTLLGVYCHHIHSLVFRCLWKILVQ